MKLNPLTVKKIKNFKSIKRGYWSFIIIMSMIAIALVAEVFVNSRALVVHYDNKYYFPVFTQMIPGTEFGLTYKYETNYRKLQKLFYKQNNNHNDLSATLKNKAPSNTVSTSNFNTNGNWIIMPIVPYNPYENDLRDGQYPPFSPSWSEKHYLGTDIMGRDIVARLVYGFRIAIFFSLVLLFLNYLVGISIGAVMGFFGGTFDLFFQRIIEILSNVPLLYVIIIISSIIVPSFFILILIMAFFGWISITWIIRTVVYKEKEREYILAARALGASNTRLIFRHILPNTISVIITFAPFAVSGGIVALTSLDYLGFGLPPPTPSWGELLSQGWANMDAWWIAGSVVIIMVITLTTVTFVGEAVREAFDPKLHTLYE